MMASRAWLPEHPGGADDDEDGHGAEHEREQSGCAISASSMEEEARR